MKTLLVAAAAIAIGLSLVAGSSCRKDRQGGVVIQYAPLPAVAAPAAPLYSPPPPYPAPTPSAPPPPAYAPAASAATVPPPPPQPPASADQAAASRSASQSDTEVLTRGPVHEAFAEPVTTNVQPGLVTPQAPPQPIREIPPDLRPQVPGVAWIPGYWAWDDDRGAFIWVSGTWRVPPPNCSWVPGYWTPAANGFQWIPGFWMAGPAEEIEYLPAPPASLEAGPVGIAPSIDYLWTPGCWYWGTARYNWRPGFWMMAQPNWVWMPAHFVWTPRGYIFVEGHWDYRLEHRGMLFAPVAFGRAVYVRPGFYYSPAIVIETPALTFALFSRPQYSHYYFGDYYEARYSRLGIYAWYEWRNNHAWFDPIYVHQQWSHRRDDPLWEAHERMEYDHRRADPGLRPAHTFAAMQDQVRRLPAVQQKAAVLAAPLSQVAAKNSAPEKFERIPDTRRAEHEKQGLSVTTYKTTRSQWETPHRTSAAGPVLAGVKPPAPTPILPPPVSAAPRVRQPEFPAKAPPVTPSASAPIVGGIKQPAPTAPPRPVVAAPEIRRPEPLPAAKIEAVKPSPQAPPPAFRPAPPAAVIPHAKGPVEVRRPEPPATVTPARPEERRDGASERVRIPRPPISGPAPDSQMRLPPRPEPSRQDLTPQPKPQPQAPALAPARPGPDPRTNGRDNETNRPGQTERR